MRYFNILGSLVFSVIGYLVLIKNHTFSLSVLDFYTYSAFLVFTYIGTQGMGVLFRKPGRQSGFYLDLIFSTVPLLIVYEAYARSASISEHYYYFRSIYLMGVILDLIIFTAVAYRFAMLMNEQVMHD